MAEQQQAAQTPGTPNVTTTPTPAPVTAPVVQPPEDEKFTGDVKGFLGAPVIEDEPAAEATTEAADTTKSIDVSDTDTATESEPTAEATDDPGVGEGDDTAAGTADGGEPTNDPEPEPAATEPAAAPAAPQQQQPAPQPDQQAAQRAARKAEAARELSAARTKLAGLKAKGDIDPFEAAPITTEIALLTAELTEIQAAEVASLQQQEAARQQALTIDQWWTDWGKNDPVGKLVGTAKGREIFLDEEAKAIKRFGPGEKATAYATAKWEARVGFVEGHAKKKADQPAAAAPAKPQPTKPTAPAGRGSPKGAAPVVPTQTASVRAAPKPQTAEERFIAAPGFSIKDDFLS